MTSHIVDILYYPGTLKKDILMSRADIRWLMPILYEDFPLWELIIKEKDECCINEFKRFHLDWGRGRGRMGMPNEDLLPLSHHFKGWVDVTQNIDRIEKYCKKKHSICKGSGAGGW